MQNLDRALGELLLSLGKPKFQIHSDMLMLERHDDIAIIVSDWIIDYKDDLGNIIPRTQQIEIYQQLYSIIYADPNNILEVYAGKLASYYKTHNIKSIAAILQLILNLHKNNLLYISVKANNKLIGNISQNHILKDNTSYHTKLPLLHSQRVPIKSFLGSSYPTTRDTITLGKFHGDLTTLKGKNLLPLDVINLQNDKQIFVKLNTKDFHKDVSHLDQMLQIREHFDGLLDGYPLHVSHAYCYRGRLYTNSGEVINYQGNDVQKNEVFLDAECTPLISLDAKASGAQLMSLMTGDITGLQATGVLSDEYTEIYTLIGEYMGEHVSRKDAKQAVMTHLYGSIKEPKRIFGREYDSFYSAIKQVIPRCDELKDLLIATWDTEKTITSWEMPDGFKVFNPSLVNLTTKITLEDCPNQPFNIAHEELQPTSRSVQNAANFVHSLDAFICREMIRACSYYRKFHERNIYFTDNESLRHYDEIYRETGYICRGYLAFNEPQSRKLGWVDTPIDVLTIHDCFRVLPEHEETVKALYHSILHDIANSNVIPWILKQIIPESHHKYIPRPQYSEELLKQIKESRGALTR